MFWPCLKLVIAFVLICLCVYALCKLFNGKCVVNCDEQEFEADAITPAPADCEVKK